MNVSFFIAKRLRFKGNVAMISIAVSFLVMIIAVAVSTGFRSEIRLGLSAITGDIRLVPPGMNVMDSDLPVESSPAYLPYVQDMTGVEAVVPVAYKAGIVKNAGNIHGVLRKGIPDWAASSYVDPFKDTLALPVSIPSRFAEISGLGPGDRMLTYFVGEEMKVRQFNVKAVHETLIEADDNIVVYADLDDIRRLNGWDQTKASCIEIILDSDHKSESQILEKQNEAAYLIYEYGSEDEETVIATSSVMTYPQLFDWLNLIDFNVLFILILMTIVAGFNMISGLLIMLFENISTIGLLKSLGMTDKSIAKVFLSSSAVLTLKGMALGNILAAVFCLIQGTTHLLRLDPENYFVSFVPVELDFGMILLADLSAFIMIMILLLIPCLFISKVDPADTVRVK